MGLIADLQKLAAAAEKLPAQLEAASAAAQTAAVAASTIAAATSHAPTAATPLPQSQVETTTTTVSVPSTTPSTLDKIESDVNAALPVIDLIPGAENIVKLLTLVVQLSNQVELIVQDIKTHSPNTWAQIASTFSSAVNDYEAVPKL